MTQHESLADIISFGIDLEDDIGAEEKVEGLVYAAFCGIFGKPPMRLDQKRRLYRRDLVNAANQSGNLLSELDVGQQREALLEALGLVYDEPGAQAALERIGWWYKRITDRSLEDPLDLGYDHHRPDQLWYCLTTGEYRTEFRQRLAIEFINRSIAAGEFIDGATEALPNGWGKGFAGVYVRFADDDGVQITIVGCANQLDLTYVNTPALVNLNRQGWEIIKQLKTAVSRERRQLVSDRERENREKRVDALLAK